MRKLRRSFTLGCAEARLALPQARREAREYEAQLTPEQRAELSVRLEQGQVDEQARLEQARAGTSSPDEEAKMRSTLESYGLADGNIAVHGRTLVVGDVIYLADEVLAEVNGAAAEGLDVPKAQLPTVTDPARFESTGQRSDFSAYSVAGVLLNPSPWTLEVGTTSADDGDFVQPGNVDANLLISDDFTDRLQRGCVETLVTTTDNDELVALPQPSSWRQGSP